jgi:hypothetical protein
VFRNRVLRTIFGPEKEGITEGWREHNEDKISDGASSAIYLECKFMDFRKNDQCKKPYIMIPVLLSEQSLSHALEDNCSAYRVL